MEVIRQEISEQLRKIGVIKYFSMRSKDKDCNEIRVYEFPDFYKLAFKKKEKIDQLDLAAILFDFVVVNCFNSTKPFAFEKNLLIYITKKEDYSTIFQKLNALYKK